jgi:ParB-like nuclease domain
MATKAEGPRIGYIPLNQMKRWPKNPKAHDIPSLRKAIRRFGFNAPLLIDEKSGKLVAGHGRLEALQAMAKDGESPPARIMTSDDGWMVPVVLGVSFKNEKEAQAYLLADNRMTELGGWNDEELARMLKEIQEDGDAALEGVGWTNDQVIDMLRSGYDVATMGPKPADQFEKTFGEGEIKQIVLYFGSEDYAAVMGRLAKVIEESKAQNNTEAFLALLDRWEKFP